MVVVTGGDSTTRFKGGDRRSVWSSFQMSVCVRLASERRGRARRLADAILDRIVHAAHKIALKGESMRKKQVKA